MARSDRPLRRTAGNKDPKSRVSVYCEGEVTEIQYFKGLRSTLRSTGLDVVVSRVAGNPRDMVDEAIRGSALRPVRTADSPGSGDQVWCVFDVEAPRCHPRIPEALALARRYGVNLAISNPCFELWLILHYASHTAYLSSQDACAILGRHIPGYDKAVIYEALAPRYDEAKRRALELQGRHGADTRIENMNPSSSVWKLVDGILALASTGRL
jgi:RloB-like protein